MSWILGNAKQDLGWLVLPGFVGFAVSLVIPEFTTAMWAYGLFVLVAVDSGHVMTTSLRTYFNPSERRSNALYWMTPLLILAGISGWYYFQFPYLWSFVLYVNIFHHVRQYYGISRWYQGKTKRFCAISSFYVYLLTLAPFVLYHFRLGARGGYYAGNDFLLFPDSVVYDKGIYIYFGMVLSWLIFEAWLYSNHKKLETGRFLSILTPAAIYGMCWLWGRNEAQVLFPILISHGVGYMGLMAHTLPRTQRAQFPVFSRALIAVIVVAVGFGALEGFGEEFLLPENTDYTQGVPSPWVALLVALHFVPQFCHFTFDAFIWRRKHSESSRVYGVGTEDQNSDVRIAS